MNFVEMKPATEEEWLAIRRKVVTATGMGVILGLNPWKSVKQLVEGMQSYEVIDNSYIWLGQELEIVVVQAVNKVLGTEYKLLENGSRSFFVDTDIKLGATPDAGDADTLLECKSTKPGNQLRWDEHPPAYYMAQLYTQLMCTGRQVGLLAILGTDLTQQDEVLRLPLSICKLRRSPEMDEIFLSTVKDFWEADAKGKTYRVNRKRAPVLELQLRALSEKIYEI